MIIENKNTLFVKVDGVGSYYVPKFDDDTLWPVPDGGTSCAQTLSYLLCETTRRREQVIRGIRKELKEYYKTKSALKNDA